MSKQKPKFQVGQYVIIRRTDDTGFDVSAFNPNFEKDLKSMTNEIMQPGRLAANDKPLLPTCKHPLINQEGVCIVCGRIPVIEPLPPDRSEEMFEEWCKTWCPTITPKAKRMYLKAWNTAIAIGRREGRRKMKEEAADECDGEQREFQEVWNEAVVHCGNKIRALKDKP